MSGPGGGANGRTSWAPYAEQREPKAVHKRPGLPEKSQSGGGTSDNIQLSEPTREAGALRQSLPARWTQTPRARSVRSGPGHWDGPRHGQPCAARQVVRPGRAQSLRCPASATFGTNSPARMVLASEPISRIQTARRGDYETHHDDLCPRMYRNRRNMHAVREPVPDSSRGSRMPRSPKRGLSARLRQPRVASRGARFGVRRAKTTSSQARLQINAYR